jgi:hypothetical protein
MRLTQAHSGSRIHLNTQPITGNNIVLAPGAADPNRGVYRDEHEPNASRRYKLFGSFASGSEREGSTLGTMMSPDGVHWGDYEPADSMHVPADTANNILYDPTLAKFIAFSRSHCTTDSCNESGWGFRRETRSLADNLTSGVWTPGVEVLHGEAGYEMYSLVPWRSPQWRAGLYLGVGSFYATTDPEGHVYCELCRSTDYGATWERVAPHRQFIPLGRNGSFDSHTCYAAPPLIDPRNASNTLFYYAGGNGPHSGGGAEHGRADFIGLAQGPTNGLIVLDALRAGRGSRHTSNTAEGDAVVVSNPLSSPQSDTVAVTITSKGCEVVGKSSRVTIELLHVDTQEVLATARFDTLPCSHDAANVPGHARVSARWDREHTNLPDTVRLRVTVLAAQLASIEV